MAKFANTVFWIRSWARDVRGSIAVKFALSLPVLAVSVLGP